MGTLAYLNARPPSETIEVYTSINYRNPDVFMPRVHEITSADGVDVRWRFPARSVSAVELTCKA